jgi:hypothetical protein
MKQADRNCGAIGKKTPTDCVVNAELSCKTYKTVH